MILTHVGGPTLLVEIAGRRLLTDPTFDRPGGHYDFGWGTSSDKLAGPALDVDELPPLDAVLLTHDHHADNLDRTGRELLARVPTVVTTRSGARRLRLPDVRGLRPGATTALEAAGRPPVTVTATPARHGPPLSRPVVGEVVGFEVRSGTESLWITGDTVLSRAVRRTARALAADPVDPIDVVVVHAGGVRFPVTGPLRYTMTGRRAVELVALTGARTAVPVHVDGWSHFVDGRAGVERAVAAAAGHVRDRLRWLVPGGSRRSSEGRREWCNSVFGALPRVL
ncbi:MBL fold metallo-hydrolase [Nocardioides sp. TF02-7]|uniref:MBL fold metallo-hydrolase n=1 Tax=Nocardioides sp. TF02-7 TaxID=2917724 RepID=UPI001F056CC5|nr:MBL fold metallo-hydrolase [Nocardioides sp. TF02-7]UMG94280.1 MBL fold metallo-hydrolase [Nocardioides sp. TF02-7]